MGIMGIKEQNTLRTQCVLLSIATMILMLALAYEELAAVHE
jgi:hypothetical protein